MAYFRTVLKTWLLFPPLYSSAMVFCNWWNQIQRTVLFFQLFPSKKSWFHYSLGCAWIAVSSWEKDQRSWMRCASAVPSSLGPLWQSQGSEKFSRNSLLSFPLETELFAWIKWAKEGVGRGNLQYLVIVFLQVNPQNVGEQDPSSHTMLVIWVSVGSLWHPTSSPPNSWSTQHVV